VSGESNMHIIMVNTQKSTISYQFYTISIL